MARFKADENVPLRVVRLMLNHGHEIDTVTDEGLAGTPDGGVAAAAHTDERCLLTLDLDFADIRFFVPGEGPGVVVLRAGTQAAPVLERVAHNLLDALTERDVGFDLWIVDEQRIRVRGPGSP